MLTSQLSRNCSSFGKYVRTISQYIYPDTIKERPIKMPEINFSIPEYKGISYQEVQEKRHKFLSPALSTFQAFKKPFYCTRGKMQYVWDHHGNRYLDLLAQNLTISVGHNHPKVLKRVTQQINNITHSTTMYYNESSILAAEELIKTLPKEEDWVVHFVNSGSEAVDLAIMLSRVYTGSWDMLSIRNAYHGLHTSAMGATGLHVCKQNIPNTSGILHVKNPDMYRGVFCDDKDAVKKYSDDIKDVITYSTPGNIAGFIFEQVQGYGGIHVLPNGYLKNAYHHVKNAGGLFIADEVQSGFGRMGTAFWSFELEDVVPDIVVTAKGLGNGLPVAAVMVKREIAEAMTKKQFFNTYGGNPTMCASSLGVLETLKEDKVQENALIVGQEFYNVLKRLQKKYPIIGDVRGMGLMYGLDIVKDPDTKEPDPEIAGILFETIRDNGIIMGLGSLHKNTLRVMPPMCVTKEDAKFLEDVFEYSMEEIQNWRISRNKYSI